MSAQVTITQLPSAGALTGTENVPIVQNGVTVQTTTGAIAGAGALNYPFLTTGSTAGLTQARALTAGAGLSLADGGAGTTLQINMTGAAAALNAASTGLLVKTGTTTVANVALSVGSGMTIVNADGVAGNPTISLSTNLQNVSSLSGTGLVTVNGTTFSQITLTGTANQIAVANGTGVSGNPTISLADNPVLPGVASTTLPSGTSLDRPASPVNGMIRYNSTFGGLEGYLNGSWQVIAASGLTGVISVGTGTGLTGGPITSTGTISIANTTVAAGSYGSATQVGTFTVNAQGQLTAAANVTITPSGIGAVASVSGTANEITATGTSSVVLSLPTALTFTGKTVTNGTFNMAAASVASDTVTTNTAAQTLTNKSMSGSANTFTNIPNSGLTNSQITLGTTNIALGGTSLTPVGLTSVTVTQDPTSNFQLATKQYVDTVATTGIHYHTAVAVASPISVGNLTATYAGGGTSTTITTIASGTYVTFASGVPTIGSQVTTATANGLTSGTQYWVTEIVGGTVQLSLTFGGAAITGLTNGTGLSIASVIKAGVNATLTNAGTQVALTIDTVLTTVGMRVLIFNQTSALQNGVYTVTTVGTASTNWVLTRASDANTYSPFSASAFGQGDAFFVSQGAQLAGETWVVSTTGSVFFGQTNITFAQISDTAIYSAGTGLALTGTQFSIANTAVTAGAYGSATQVGTFTVNAQGQLTLAGNSSIAINGNQITSGLVAIANGGTNSSATATAGGAGYGTGTAHAYTAVGTAGQVLTSAGASAPTWSGISGGTF